MSQGMHSDRTARRSISAVLGPLLMSVGDLMHPPEVQWDPNSPGVWCDHGNGISDRVACWYVSHLLLFIGFLVLVFQNSSPSGHLTAAAVQLFAPAGYAARKFYTFIGLGRSFTRGHQSSGRACCIRPATSSDGADAVWPHNDGYWRRFSVRRRNWE
jgi:hypothetical protein